MLYTIWCRTQGASTKQQRSSLGISGMTWDGARTVTCRSMQCLVLVSQDVGVPVAHLASELQEKRTNPLGAPALQG